MTSLLLFQLLICIPFALSHKKPVIQSRLVNRNPLSLINNGYEDLLVTIDPNVVETPTAINDIQAFLKEASTALYAATEERAYINHVTILVPSDWTPNSSYHLTHTETPDMANIILTSDPVAGGAIHTVRYGGCGTGGEYMSVNDNVFKNAAATETVFGNRGKLFVHEWGHYRWGLYDEYPDPKGHQYYHYQYKIEGVRCGTPIQGRFFKQKKECGLNKHGCKFVPDDNPSKASGSLMYYHWLNQVVGFCKNYKSPDKDFHHNFRAPTTHNRMCRLRSAWEVMEAHEDFSAGKNPRSGLSVAQAVPQFHVVQDASPRRVLVLDYSLSMRGSEVAMFQAVRDLVYNNVEENSYLGIVGFASTAFTIAPMTRVSGKAVRETLASSVVLRLRSATSSGSGLLKMLDVLKAGGLPLEGATCVLMTDGDENRAPYLATVVPNVKAAGISCDVMEFGSDAPNLSDAAAELGGTRYKALKLPGDPSLMDSMRSTITSKYANRRRTQMLSEGNTVKQNATVAGNFTVAECMEPGSVTFTAYYTTNVSMIEATLQSPSGKVYDKRSPGYKHNAKAQVMSIGLNETDTGMWFYSIASSASTPVTYNALANFVNTTCAISVKTDVQQERRWSDYSIYTTVTKGSKPVIGATVIVKFRSRRDEFTRVLLDSGSGPDAVAGDGIYSGMVLRRDFRYWYKVDTYSTVVTVSGTKGEVFAISAVDGIGAPSKTTTNQPPAAMGAFSIIGPTNQAITPNNTGFNASYPTDVYPPSQVTDLSVSPPDYYSTSFALAWTAPGDDYYFGQAVRYDIRWSHDPFKLRDSFNTCAPVNSTWLNGWSQTPLLGVERENITVTLPEPVDEVTYWFALLAVDDEGLEGDVSNLVAVTVGYATAAAGGPGINWLIIAIIGATLLLLFLLLIPLCVIMGICKRKKNKLEDSKQAEATKYAKVRPQYNRWM